MSATGVPVFAGASTSVAAFLGTAHEGPLNIAAHVFEFGDFVSVFGDLAEDCHLGFAVREFFQNGGSEAFVARIADLYSSLPGDRARHQGLYSLEDVEQFNLLCLPGVDEPAVLAEAQLYCAERGAFFIMDAPLAAQTPGDLLTVVSARRFPKSEHAAIYYPWVYVADADGAHRRLAPPSGGIAGLYARTDAERGVWRAPSGNRAKLVDVQALNYLVSDEESDRLNRAGINCLRMFPDHGAVCWSANTLRKAEQMASEFDHVPVRRMANFIEDSICQGLTWAMFETNGPALWLQIGRQVEAFMHGLFVGGAFQGKTEHEAYLVKCDGVTTRQTDIDLGHVNLVVAFAPLRPNDLVTINIQVLAGALAVS
jgi:hypothetical protein